MTQVSVIIPTHNRWSLLRRTLAGALAQEGVDLEVLVVDDGSTDGTTAQLEALSEPRLHLLRNEEPLGVAKARNLGLERAGGEWVAFLDDDDVWSPQKLTRQIGAAEAADAPFAYTSAVLVDSSSLAPIAVQPAPHPARALEETLRYCAIPGGCSNAIVRTELAREAGGFDPAFTIAEDWDMWIRMLLASDGRAASCGECLYGYVQHASSSVVRNRRLAREDYERIVAKYAGERKRRGVDFDAVTLSRWVAGNHRRAGDRRGAAGVYLRTAWRQHSPGDALRAGGLLFGESAMNRFSGHGGAIDASSASWLELYRPGGKLESVGSSVAASAEECR